MPVDPALPASYMPIRLAIAAQVLGHVYVSVADSVRSGAWKPPPNWLAIVASDTIVLADALIAEHDRTAKEADHAG